MFRDTACRVSVFELFLLFCYDDAARVMKKTSSTVFVKCAYYQFNDSTSCLRASSNPSCYRDFHVHMYNTMTTINVLLSCN